MKQYYILMSEEKNLPLGDVKQAVEFSQDLKHIPEIRFTLVNT
jgi:hypothetical protein